jgi:preprotein translocase subunit SecG
MFTKFLNGYYFNTIGEFLQSLAPSHKYHAMLEVILFSSFTSMVQDVFGFKTLTLIAFIFSAIVELISGVYASVITKDEKMQSSKMARFILKLFIWLSVFFILNAFAMEYVTKDNLIHAAFDWMYNTLIVWCAGEYIVSILENKAVIDGKEKSAYVEAIKAKLQSLITRP